MVTGLRRRVQGICFKHSRAACTHPACCVLPGFQSSDEEPDLTDLDGLICGDENKAQVPVRAPFTPEAGNPGDFPAPSAPITPSDIGVRAPFTPKSGKPEDLPAPSAQTSPTALTVLADAPSAPTVLRTSWASTSTEKDQRTWQWYGGRWHYNWKW